MVVASNSLESPLPAFRTDLFARALVRPHPVQPPVRCKPLAACVTRCGPGPPRVSRTAACHHPALGTEASDKNPLHRLSGKAEVCVREPSMPSGPGKSPA